MRQHTLRDTTQQAFQFIETLFAVAEQQNRENAPFIADPCQNIPRQWTSTIVEQVFGNGGLATYRQISLLAASCRATYVTAESGRLIRTPPVSTETSPFTRTSGASL